MDPSSVTSVPGGTSTVTPNEAIVFSMVRDTRSREALFLVAETCKERKVDPRVGVGVIHSRIRPGGRGHHASRAAFVVSPCDSSQSS